LFDKVLQIDFFVFKIFNNTKLPIAILDLDSVTGKSSHRIESNKDYYVPIDLLYKNSHSPIIIGIDEYDMNIYNWII